ncbi:MAG TPA: alpha/beta fold hydrolase [Candidatus Eisenbacteria bacterium]|nr:alpha/beta fold hydrolase [Candidatus Eisenbacteria bacterium]
MELHFEAQGKGHPLLILHGLLGSSDNWRAIARRLAASLNVFTVDLRNHGRSPRSDAMNYAFMAADLLELMERQKIGGPHILGHSIGGKVAMQLAAECPERIEKLVVVDIAPRAYPPAHRRLLETLRLLDIGRYQSFTELDRALAIEIPETPTRQLVLKNIARGDNRRLRWKIDIEAIASNYENLIAAITPRNVFSKPALFIRGGRSDYMGAADVPLIRQTFPAARIETVAAAGHWVHADAPDEFLRVVSGFLAER